MTFLLLAIALVGCSSPALPPLRVGGVEVVVERAQLATLASSSHEPRGPVVYLSDAWDDLSPVEQWWVLAHELCHLRGVYDERDADCCAWRWCADSFGWTDLEALEVAALLRPSRRDLALLECAMEAR